MRQKFISRLNISRHSIFQPQSFYRSLHQTASNQEHAYTLLKANKRRFNRNFSQFMPNSTPQWVRAKTLTDYISILGVEKGKACQAYINERTHMHTIAYEIAQEIAGKNPIIKAYTSTLTKLIVAQAGMGECDEQTNYCFALSHARGWPGIVKVCLNMGTGSTGQKYPHLFLLIGEMSYEKIFSSLLSQSGALDNLDKLPSHITLLDPLIKDIRPANDWKNSPLYNSIKLHQEALNSAATIEGVGIGKHAEQERYLYLMETAEEVYDQYFADKPDSSDSRSNSI